MLKYLKEHWIEMIGIVVVMAMASWFILMLSERVVPWSDDPFQPRIHVNPTGR